MMGLMEVTLQPRGYPLRYYNLATTGPLSTKMKEDTPLNVTSTKEWGNLLPRMKFICNLK